MSKLGFWILAAVAPLGVFALIPLDSVRTADAQIGSEPQSRAIELGAGWSPDGMGVRFQSGQASDLELPIGQPLGIGHRLDTGPVTSRTPSPHPSAAFVVTRLTEHSANDFAPSFSPDGTKIAFNSDRVSGHADIFSMDSDGSNVTLIADMSGNAHHSAWSPDGTKVAFDHGYHIWVVDPDGSDISRVTQNSPNHWQYHPAWSPDGTKIAFTSRSSGNWDIHIMNADGSNVRRVTDNRAWDNSPAWSPDGTKIAFISNRGRNYDMFVMNADGSNVNRITESRYDNSPAWSPDGTKIAFTSDRDGEPSVYVINTDGSGITRITDPRFHDQHPSWSSDGTRIAFNSQRNGNWDIYVVNVRSLGVGPATPDPTPTPPRDKAALVAFYNATHALGVKWHQDKNWLSDKPLGEWHGVRTDHHGNVVYLELPKNGLRGTIPTEISKLIDLRQLDLSGNNLTGEIPDELGKLKGLQELYVSGNGFTGCIPNELQRVKINDFDDLKIPFCGSKLHTPDNKEPKVHTPEDKAVLTAIYHATKGDRWNRNDNWLSDKPLNDWLGVNADSDGRVMALRLPRNGLTGEIPEEIGELTELQILDLSTNSLSGRIPVSMGNLLKLTDLLLAENDDLSGCVPTPLSSRVGRGFGRNDIIFASLSFCNESNGKLGTPESPDFVKKWNIGESVPKSEARAARLGVQWLDEYAKNQGWDMINNESVNVFMDTTPPSWGRCVRRWPTHVIRGCSGPEHGWADAHDIFVRADHPDNRNLHTIGRLQVIAETAAHEAVHALLQWQLAGTLGPIPSFHPPPLWFTEGMATYFAAAVVDEHLTPYLPDPPEGKRRFDEVRRTWVSDASELTLPVCNDQGGRDTYYCGALAIELLASKVGGGKIQFGMREIIDFHATELRWSKVESLDGWEKSFEEAFGITVDAFYDLYECYADNDFDYKKMDRDTCS